LLLLFIAVLHQSLLLAQRTKIIQGNLY